MAHFLKVGFEFDLFVHLAEMIWNVTEGWSFCPIFYLTSNYLLYLFPTSNVLFKFQVFIMLYFLSPTFIYIYAGREAGWQADRQTGRQTDRHTHIHTYIQTHTYIHTYTHIHTYIHIYIHTSLVDIWWPWWTAVSDIVSDTPLTVTPLVEMC